VIAALLAAAAVSAAMPAAMPSGSFACQRLMTDTFERAAADDYVPSVLGTLTLDGKGGYSHVQGNGKVVREKAYLRFAAGPAKGVAAAMRIDAKGRVYLLIDRSIVGYPQASPHRLDAVCYKT